MSPRRPAPAAGAHAAVRSAFRGLGRFLLSLRRVLGARLAERALVELAAAGSWIAFSHEKLLRFALHIMRKAGRRRPRRHARPALGSLDAYQRFGAPPRLPPPPLVRSWASFTRSGRPPSSLPLRFWMARDASARDISTNPKPRGRPVSRSVMMLTDSTVPCAANSSRISASVAENGRLPT